MSLKLADLLYLFGPPGGLAAQALKGDTSNKGLWKGFLGGAALTGIPMIGAGLAGAGPLAGALGGSAATGASAAGATTGAAAGLPAETAAMLEAGGYGAGAGAAPASSVGSFLGGLGKIAAGTAAAIGTARALTPEQKMTQYTPLSFQQPMTGAPQLQPMTSHEEQLRKLGFV